MFRLNEEQICWLLARPESGMGYQRVEIKLEQQTMAAVAYNADLLLLEAEPRSQLKLNHRQLLEEAKSVDGAGLRLISVLVESSSRNATKLAETDNDGPATDAEPKKTQIWDKFARFTAYRNDRRIRDDKSLVPGTYATTKADADKVKTGSQAVSRYALPDPKPAKYRFDVEPKAGTKYRQGIVQPEFGQPGGGIEALFDDGTNPGSVSGPSVLPE